MSDDDTASGVDRDVELLAELDRLQAASLLSAGLAHEVANPLLGVIANLAEIERLYARLRASVGPAHAERWDVLAECLDQASRSADAIADVVRDFQAFLRPAANRVERLVEPGPLVERAIRMARPRITATAGLRTSIAKTPLVKAAPSFITQIALNLLFNASDGFAGSEPNRSQIDVRVAVEDAMVVLEVEDNGPGLDAAVAARVFEPHATAKMSGSSLGLGLSICRGLAERIGGTISLRSAPGEGSCFRVTLPIASA